MVKLFVKKLILLSVFTAALYALLPDRGAGKFAKQAIELIKLILIMYAVLELIK